MLAHFIEQLDAAKHNSGIDGYTRLLQRFLFDGLNKEVSAHDVFMIVQEFCSFLAHLKELFNQTAAH